MISPRTRAALAAAFLAVAGAVTYGLATVEHPDADPYHVIVPWPDGGTTPDGWPCYELDGLTTPEARILFDVNGNPVAEVIAEGGVTDAGQRYCHLRIPVDVDGWDGGDTGPTVPDDYLSLRSTEHEVDAGLCVHRLEVWCGEAPYGCACAPADATGTPTASDCEALLPDGGWGPAPVRVHLREGEWRGACRAKPCAEFGGQSSWPEACGPETLPTGGR